MIVTIYSQLRMNLCCYILIELLKKCHCKVIFLGIKLELNDLKILGCCSVFIILISANNGQIPPTAKIITIFGILGRIRLLAGYYLVVITERTLVGPVSGHDIWKIDNIELVPFPKAFLHMNQKQVNQYLDIQQRQNLLFLHVY